MTGQLIVERGSALFPGADPYRRIGPFDADTIPAGLRRRHDLKPGAWGVLHILSGGLRFCWDDEQGGCRMLSAGERMLIPPAVPHHLETSGPVTITIAFHSAADA